MASHVIRDRSYSEEEKRSILAKYIRESLIRDIDFAYDDPHGFSPSRAEVKEHILHIMLICEMCGLDWDELAKSYGPSDFEKARLEEILNS